MKVSLNIENDKELRLYIKDLIKGQVKSIISNEFIEIAKQELDKKIKNISANTFDSLFRNVLKTCINDIININYEKMAWGQNFIKPHIENYFNGIDIDNLVNLIATKLAKEKLNTLLK